jgi:hypothetical protein
MACPQVSVREEGLQIWRVAAYIWNRQSWTAARGGLAACRLGSVLTSDCNILTCYGTVYSASDLGLNLWNDVSNRKWTEIWNMEY